MNTHYQCPRCGDWLFAEMGGYYQGKPTNCQICRRKVIATTEEIPRCVAVQIVDVIWRGKKTTDELLEENSHHKEEIKRLERIIKEFTKTGEVNDETQR